MKTKILLILPLFLCGCNLLRLPSDNTVITEKQTQVAEQAPRGYNPAPQLFER